MLETSVCAENAPHEHASKPARPPDRPPAHEGAGLTFYGFRVSTVNFFPNEPVFLL